MWFPSLLRSRRARAPTPAAVPPRPAMAPQAPRALLLVAAAGLLLLLLLPLSSSSSSDACGPCEPASCPPLPPRGCPLGETRDACGCCPVCARGEGEPCGGGGPGRAHCAQGMECVKSRKRRKGKAGAAAAAGGAVVSGVCVCKSRYPVCGSDGITYPSGCQLRAASLRAESRGDRAITQLSKGTCEQGGHTPARPSGGSDPTGRAPRECPRPQSVRVASGRWIRGKEVGIWGLTPQPPAFCLECVRGLGMEFPLFKNKCKKKKNENLKSECKYRRFFHCL